MTKLKQKMLILLSLFSFLSISILQAQSEFFWEQERFFSPQTGTFPVSAYSSDFSALAWQEVAPNRAGGSGYINIHLAVKEAETDWEQRGIIAGPYAYLGTEPSIISMAIDNKGRILITAAAAGTQVDILISGDRGRSFLRQTLNMGEGNSVAPRIYVRADGGYLLFVTRGRSQSLSIYYSRSNDGITWSPFEFFTPENNLALNFLPAHASAGHRDMVFFQSLIMGADSLSTFQLFSKHSDNGGQTWSAAERFTTFNDPVMQTQAEPNNFDNQRPHLAKFGNNFFLVWERRYSSQPPQIYSATINQNGKITGTVERVNSEEAYCNNPVSFIFKDSPSVVWFDNRRGNNRIILAQRGDFDWKNQILSSVSMEASFARPVIDNDSAYIFWQGMVRNSGRIFILSPDRSVQSPQVAAVNFTPSRAARSERARLSWTTPSDTSGIFGYSWTWSQDENVLPPEEVQIYNSGGRNQSLELTADKDGQWFFNVRALDFAGNWSEPGRIVYNRKTVPPSAVSLIEPETDDDGYLVSNSFNVAWEPPEDPFIAGYTWNLQFMGGAQTALAAPPSRIMGTEKSVNYENQENGLWAFTVSAIDQAGNIGERASITFRTNKFIPFTGISYIDASQDAQGTISIRILGRGFTSNGRITSVILSNEKQDIPAAFTILSDREIGGLTFENLEEGVYRLRIEHSSRGWYTAPSVITAGRSATVKFGDYSREWKPSWSVQPQGKITINPVMALAAILIVFCALGLFASVRGIGSVIAESAVIKQEALAIITGDFMPMEKKQKFVRILKKERGLRFKLASFTTGLVLLVVIMISTPVYFRISESQRRTLLQGLYDRSKVLLEGLASSAKAHLPRGDEGMIELGFLPAQSAALPEADYITITGYGPGSIYNDHVMATNDPDILSKIDTTELRYGVSRITDELSPLYEQISAELNNRAKEETGDLPRSIMELSREAQQLARRFDDASMRRVSDIQVTIRSLEAKLMESLTHISNDIYSYPQYSNESILKDKIRKFIFYKPVIFQQGTDDNYFRGLIRLEVSVDPILETISREQTGLLYTIAIFAIIALLIGVIGALILSTLIIRPIKKLVSHIEIIRDTENKAKLEGVDIHISTKDEIAVLGNTINDMTHGLVKAALAASDLSIGKEIQKKFIPLDLDSYGNKKSSGFKKTANLNFFGYYEGAKGVSGDYFDYRDLDGRYFAIIKCDVAGKGIPAALIMIQVATMFLNYFKQWKPTEKGMHIEEVVYQINEFIETLAFKGRFAAFSLCLFDSATGIVRFCNAGDKIVHLYDESEGRIKTISLPETPATGVLPNSMIEAAGGYKVQTLNIDHGDILLLYTDGIEEAKRRFRDGGFKEIICTEGELNSPHENHLCGQADEELGPDRVEAIINAVMARKVYTLKKYHNPEGEIELQFDFSTCQSRVEDVIMAMVSVEKMFRCYKHPDAGEESRILVDKKVDEFLKDHFLQYRRYCLNTREYPENEAYMYYTHVKEDEQYDDLTILGIKRK